MGILIVIILLIPLSSAQNFSLKCSISDRYNGSLSISQEFGEDVKKLYDTDHSGYLEKNEVISLLRDKGLRLNFTSVLNTIYFLQNFTLDGRTPMINAQDIHVNLTIPMPVNGTSIYTLSFAYTFYLNGTSDHILKITLPHRSGMFSLDLPENNTIVKNNLRNAKIEENHIEGNFTDSIVIIFREEYYYWMNIYAIALTIGLLGAFIFVAKKLRGGPTKGIKLLIKSILRNLVALFIVLTVLFYILWVVGPPPEVRIGGISTMFARFHIIKYYHLDRPWYDQYLNWWYLLFTGGIAKGVNWGKQPIDLKNAILVSLTIFILGTLMSYLISIYLAIRKRSSRNLDIYAAVFLALYSIPTFYAALLIVHQFERWPMLYTMLVAPSDPLGWGFRIFIVSLTLSILTIARPYLIAKSLATKEFTEPYVRTFHAVGMPFSKIKKFVRRNTMIPTITDAALNFGWFLTAQVFLEVIFLIQGVGYILFRGTVEGNPFQIQIAIIYFSLVMITASIFSDIVIYFLDPRVRR